MALGPIFVVMALFDGTRGLFTGWLKGVVMLALAPLFAVLAGTIMLELAVPVLGVLTQNPQLVDPQAAMAFFVIGAVHVALMVMVVKVAGTMVAGWQVFGLVPARDHSGDTGNMLKAQVAGLRTVEARQVQAGGSPGGSRRIDVSAVATGSPANDSGGSGQTVRETRVFATSSAGGQTPALNPAASRTRGIGNRFRPAPASAKTLEKMT